MAVFKKQGVYCIGDRVNGHRKRERIGLGKNLPETILQEGQL